MKRQRDQMLADAQRSLDARTDALANLQAHEESLVEGGLQTALDLVRASVGAELAERVATLEARRDHASGNAKPAAVSTRSLRQKRLKSEGGADDDEDDAATADAGGAALGGALAALASAGAAASKNNDGPSGRRKRAQSPASMLLDKQLDEDEVRSDMYDIARDMQLLEASAADSQSSSSGRSNGRSANSSSSSGSLPYKRPAARVPSAAPQFRSNRVASGAFGQASSSNGSYGTGSSLPGADASRRHANAHSAGNGQSCLSSGPSSVKSQSALTAPKAAVSSASAMSSLSVAPGETLVVPNIKLGQVRCGADVFEKGDLVRALQAPPPEPKSGAKVKEVGSGSSSSGGGNGKASVASSVVGTVSSVNNSEVHLRLEDGSKHRIYLSHLRNRRTTLNHT